MEQRRWLSAEMHCHSTNSDGKLTPEEVVALYEEKRYDVLAITDHNVLTKVSSQKLVIIPAYEDSSGCWPFFSHLLIYFLKEMPSSLDDAVFQGALICVAHPVTWPFWKKIPPQVMGYEEFNGGLARKYKIAGRMANKIAALWYKRFYKIRVAGTDAHERKDYGEARLWIWAKPDLEDIKKALLEGRIRIKH